MVISPLSPNQHNELFIVLLCSTEVNIFLDGVKDQELTSSNHVGAHCAKCHLQLTVIAVSCMCVFYLLSCFRSL